MDQLGEEMEAKGETPPAECPPVECGQSDGATIVIKLTCPVVNGTSLETTGLGRAASGPGTVLRSIIT